MSDVVASVVPLEPAVGEVWEWFLGGFVERRLAQQDSGCGSEFLTPRHGVQRRVGALGRRVACGRAAYGRDYAAERSEVACVDAAL